MLSFARNLNQQIKLKQKLKVNDKSILFKFRDVLERRYMSQIVLQLVSVLCVDPDFVGHDSTA